MSAHRIAKRYAKSLIELANEEGRLDKVLDDINAFGEALKNRDFLLMIKSPVVPGSKKTAIVKEIFGESFDKLTLLFFETLIRKGREGFLPDIAKVAAQQYKTLNKISTVTITTAQKVSDKAIKSISDRLNESTATDENIEVVTTIDPNIIGGFVATFDDKILDASVLTKLQNLKKSFTGNLYISKIIAK